MRNLSLITRLVPLMLVLSATGVSAQHDQKLEYAVKFICGRTEQPVVAPGEYFTAINVHNGAERTSTKRGQDAHHSGSRSRQ